MFKKSLNATLIFLIISTLISPLNISANVLGNISYDFSSVSRCDRSLSEPFFLHQNTAHIPYCGYANSYKYDGDTVFFGWNTDAAFLNIQGSSFEITDTVSKEIVESVYGTEMLHIVMNTNIEGVTFEINTYPTYENVMVYTFKIINNSTKQIEYKIGNGIDTDYEYNDRIPLVSMGPKKGVSMTGSDHKLIINTDYSNGPDAYIASEYSHNRDEFVNTYANESTYAPEDEILTSETDTGISLLWDGSIMPGEQYEGKFSIGVSEINTVSVEERYLDATTMQEIVPSTESFEPVGQTYLPNEIDLNGYNYVSNNYDNTPLNNDIVITHLYEKDKNTVKEVYLDSETGQEIAPMSENDVIYGEDYQPNLIDIEGYNYNYNDYVEGGIFSDTVITHYYDATKYDVTEKFIDADTLEEISNPLVSSVKHGDVATLSNKNIEDYSYVSNNYDNLAIKSDKEIIHLYEHNSYNVEEIYIDEDGNPLAKPYVSNIDEGEIVATKKVDIYGYDYISNDYNGEPLINDLKIIHNYKVSQYAVEEIFIDSTTGKEISPSVVTNVKHGDVITPTLSEINNYDYISNDYDGSIIKGDLKIVHSYDYIEDLNVSVDKQIIESGDGILTEGEQFKYKISVKNLSNYDLDDVVISDYMGNVMSFNPHILSSNICNDTDFNDECEENFDFKDSYKIDKIYMGEQYLLEFDLVMPEAILKSGTMNNVASVSVDGDTFADDVSIEVEKSSENIIIEEFSENPPQKEEPKIVKTGNMNTKYVLLIFCYILVRKLSKNKI